MGLLKKLLSWKKKIEEPEFEFVDTSSLYASFCPEIILSISS